MAHGHLNANEIQALDLSPGPLGSVQANHLDATIRAEVDHGVPDRRPHASAEASIITSSPDEPERTGRRADRTQVGARTQ